MNRFCVVFNIKILRGFSWPVMYNFRLELNRKCKDNQIYQI